MRVPSAALEHVFVPEKNLCAQAAPPPPRGRHWLRSAGMNRKQQEHRTSQQKANSTARQNDKRTLETKWGHNRTTLQGPSSTDNNSQRHNTYEPTENNTGLSHEPTHTHTHTHTIAHSALKTAHTATTQQQITTIVYCLHWPPQSHRGGVFFGGGGGGDRGTMVPQLTSAASAPRRASPRPHALGPGRQALE